MCACMHACVHACMHVCVHACMHACMCVGMHVCLHACMHACVHVCMHACMHVSTWETCDSDNGFKTRTLVTLRCLTASMVLHMGHCSPRHIEQAQFDMVLSRLLSMHNLVQLDSSFYVQSNCMISQFFICNFDGSVCLLSMQWLATLKVKSSRNVKKLALLDLHQICCAKERALN